MSGSGAFGINLILLRILHFGLSAFSWVNFGISQVWGALIKQKRENAVCSLSQDASYKLVGQIYPVICASCFMFFCFLTGGSSIVSGMGALVCPLAILACEYYLELQTKPSGLYKGLIWLYTGFGIAVVVLTALGETLVDISYSQTRENLLGVYGIALGCYQFLTVCLFVNYMVLFSFEKRASNHNEILHAINCLISYSCISLFSIFSSLCYNAYKEGYYFDFSFLLFFSLLNILMHLKAMGFVSNGIFISQMFMYSNFITTLLNNSLNFMFRGMYSSNPYIIPIAILHLCLILTYLAIQICTEGVDSLVLNDTLDGFEAFQAFEHNSRLSNFGAFGERFLSSNKGIAEPGISMV